ncbi:uncharacterized protein Dsimw501_GD24168, isoform B [Drosophila simulans]|uniref:Uncharacterized protein, isoform B n=1 Tax=Drosophila simulans TaxID=7240 RepID=A0A0J9R3S4_DROSI|nr:uncharacterized protein Dsimw501_GD24168, isoform B [Drosophila simulans]
MRMRLLVIWISLTALLEWSRAQEDNIEESPTDDPEPTQEVSSNGSQVGQVGHQSGEDEKQPEVASPDTNLETDNELEEDKEEPEKKSTGNPGGSPPTQVPQTDKVDQSSGHMDIPDSSSEVTPDTRPSTSPEEVLETHPTNKTEEPVGGSPDYPADGPQEETTTPPPEETTLAPTKPPVADPEQKPLSCYSCMFCNKTITNETKSNCGPIPGKRNGCRTILLIDPNVVPGKKYFLHRGCVSELDMELSRYCAENEKLCPTCYEDNCNVHNMTEYEVTPGSAAVTHHPGVLFLIWSIGLLSWQVAF